MASVITVNRCLESMSVKPPSAARCRRSSRRIHANILPNKLLIHKREMFFASKKTKASETCVYWAVLAAVHVVDIERFGRSAQYKCNTFPGIEKTLCNFGNHEVIVSLFQQLSVFDILTEDSSLYSCPIFFLSHHFLTFIHFLFCDVLGKYRNSKIMSLLRYLACN